MIPFLILASALAMFAPMDKTEPQTPSCADTLYVTEYRHIEWEMPIPVMVTDSVVTQEVRP